MQEYNRLQLKNGRKLGYAEYGDPKGKPLFFFHGWPSSRLQAKITDESAKKLRIRVIAIDRPGYGLSDYIAERNLLDWPEDVIALADKLQIKKFNILGVSGGAPYAAACAYKVPERIGKVGIAVGLSQTNVKGILSGEAFLTKIGWIFFRFFPIFMQLTVKLHAIQVKYFRTNFFSFLYYAKEDRTTLSAIGREAVLRNREEAFRQGTNGAALDLKLYTNPWGFSLNEITSKTYLWYGEKDKNVSVNMGKYYASQIKESKLTIYPNEGHFLLRSHISEILRTTAL